jgi:AraC-like DNA-binding protein
MLETYRYAPGPTGGAPQKHYHDGYQLGFSPDSPGEFRYRGDRYPVPIGVLSVIHPGEVHVTRDPVSLPAPATYRMAYVDPTLFADAAAVVAGREAGGEPFFPGVTVRDEDLVGGFARLCAAVEDEAPRLERDSLLSSLLPALVARHAEGHRRPREAGKEHRAVRLVRECLVDNLAENVSLRELARPTGLNPTYLLQVFAEEVGMPPHAYQRAARVWRAKRLLIEGVPLSQVASETGFYDQSHLTRHFKRHVGVAPGNYARNSRRIRES